MTRYDAILLLIVLLLVALGGYFIYRETTDPILLPGGQEEVAETAAADAAASPGAAATPIADDDSAVTPDGTAEQPGAEPEVVQASFEEEISGQFGQLATLMESHIASFVGSMQEQSSAQGEKLESASLIIQEALDSYEAEARNSVTELSDTLNLIDEMRNESDTITSSLDEARTGWDQLFDDVSTIDALSGNRLDEENFEFQTYLVGATETLSEIAKSLETAYDLPESDLSYLLNRFNDIEYRYYSPGGRRTPYRVIANESLRVPVPRTAGEIIGDFEIPEKIRSQVSTINHVVAANTNLRNNLSRQVGKLQRLEANLSAIESMSQSLAELDLSNPESITTEAALSPELREAWLEFEMAAAAYRAASGSEEEKLAQERLKQAISHLLQQYEMNYLNMADAPKDPVDFYLRFMEKYSPRQLSQGQ
ncbi:MAG: hypothetical protein AB3N33_05695 [Puniceicoccaceae bacterium]